MANTSRPSRRCAVVRTHSRKSYSTLTSPSRSRTNFRKRLLQLISLQASSTRRRFSFGTPPTNPERADGHVVVVVETDETDGHKRAAVHLKARLNLLLTAELLHAEANLLLLKGFYNELGGMILFHIGSPF